MYTLLICFRLSANTLEIVFETGHGFDTSTWTHKTIKGKPLVNTEETVLAQKADVSVCPVVEREKSMSLVCCLYMEYKRQHWLENVCLTQS